MISDGVIAFDVQELRGVFPPAPGHAPCDFCNTGVPVWTYPTRPALMATIVTSGIAPIAAEVAGDWDACGECADLVEAGDWPALARRALRVSGMAEACRGGPPGLRVRLLATLSQAHRCFRPARTTEPRRPVDTREVA